MMPIMMGIRPQFGMAFSQSNLMSLVGHLIFGGIAGVVYARRSSEIPSQILGVRCELYGENSLSQSALG
jgi:hypothetical protein